MQSKPEISGIPGRKDAIKMYLGFCEKTQEPPYRGLYQSKMVNLNGNQNNNYSRLKQQIL